MKSNGSSKLKYCSGVCKKVQVGWLLKNIEILEKLVQIPTKHNTGMTNITLVVVHIHPCEQERGEKWRKG